MEAKTVERNTSVLNRQTYAERNLIVSLQAVIDGHKANQRHGTCLAAVVVCQHSGVADIKEYLEKYFSEDIRQIGPSRYAVMSDNEVDSGWMSIYATALEAYLAEHDIPAGIGFASYQSNGSTAQQIYDQAVSNMVRNTMERMHAKKDLRE